jgi:hypothetical protein
LQEIKRSQNSTINNLHNKLKYKGKAIASLKKLKQKESKKDRKKLLKTVTQFEKQIKDNEKTNIKYIENLNIEHDTKIKEISHEFEIK